MNYKKILKVLAVIVILFIATLVAAPLLLKGKIKAAVLTAINKNLNAKVAFDEADLSLFSSFPQASLKLKNVSVINNAPFENDTLAYVKELGLDMPIKELFKRKTKQLILRQFQLMRLILILFQMKMEFQIMT